jgi:hypothetical protein
VVVVVVNLDTNDVNPHPQPHPLLPAAGPVAILAVAAISKVADEVKPFL